MASTALSIEPWAVMRTTETQGKRRCTFSRSSRPVHARHADVGDQDRVGRAGQFLNRRLAAQAEGRLVAQTRQRRAGGFRQKSSLSSAMSTRRTVGRPGQTASSSSTRGSGGGRDGSWGEMRGGLGSSRVILTVLPGSPHAWMPCPSKPGHCRVRGATPVFMLSTRSRSNCQKARLVRSSDPSDPSDRFDPAALTGWTRMWQAIGRHQAVFSVSPETLHA